MEPEVTERIMTMKEAIKKFVSNGSFVYIGGYVCRSAFAAVHEIIRQKKRNLTVTRSNMSDDFDQLVGAGCVKRLISSFLSLGFHGLSRCFRRAMEKKIPHEIEIEEYTNLSLPMMLLAGSLGIPFIPTKDLLGSDILKHRGFRGENKYHIINSPFTREEVLVVPALNPDVGIIHVQQVDAYGNAQMWGIGGDCKFGANASKKVIVTAERIVSRELIGRDPSRTIIPGFRVNAVVECPWGSHPNYVPGFYDVDFDFGGMYSKAARDVKTLEEFFDEWVYGVEDRAEYINHYIQKFGYSKLEELRAKPFYSYSVNYGY